MIDRGYWPLALTVLYCVEIPATWKSINELFFENIAVKNKWKGKRAVGQVEHDRREHQTHFV